MKAAFVAAPLWMALASCSGSGSPSSLADSGGSGHDGSDGGSGVRDAIANVDGDSAATAKDAGPTVYCASKVGPVDSADQPDVGTIETCTPEYPTCLLNACPECGGWQCCRVTSSGGACM
jgi:hypothetical protein